MESYAFSRSMKHMEGDIPAFRPNCLQPVHHKHHVHSRAILEKSALLLQLRSLGFAVVAEPTSDHVKGHLARARNEEDASVVSLLGVTVLLVDYRLKTTAMIAFVHCHGFLA